MFSYSVRSPKRIGTSLVFIIFPHFESRMIHLEQYRMRKIIQDNHNPCGEGGSAPIRNCPLHSLNHDQVLFSEFLLAYRQDIIPIHFHSPNPSSFIISVWHHSIISIAIRTQPAIVWRPSRSGQPPSTVATANSSWMNWTASKRSDLVRAPVITILPLLNIRQTTLG